MQRLASWLFARRLLAYGIDMALAFGLLWLIGRFLGGESGVFSTVRSDITKNVLFSLFMLLFEWAGNGRTPGKRLTGLRVVRTDLRKAGFYPLLYREFVGRLAVEKANLFVVYALGATGAMNTLREAAASPLLDTLLTAAVSLPWLTFVSFAFALCRPDGRALHDLLSDTMVVKVHTAGNSQCK